MSIIKSSILLVIFLSLTCVGRSQNLNGLYVMDFGPYDDAYIIFSRSSFTYFKMDNGDIKEVDVTHVGRGSYDCNGKQLNLHFKADSIDLKYFLVADSLSCSYISDTASDHTEITLAVKVDNQPGPGTLGILRGKRRYAYTIKDNYITVQVPSKPLITSIKFLIITYEPRELPFDNHFNRFSYVLHVRDKRNRVSIITDSMARYNLKPLDKDKWTLEPGRMMYKASELHISTLKAEAAKNERLRYLLKDIL